MKPTRIAYICADPGVPVFGRKGCSVHVQEVIRALLRRGCQVELFATRFDAEQAPRGLENVTVHHLPPAPKGELAQREEQCLGANDELMRLLDEAGPFDLVYERYSLWSDGAIRWATRNSVRSIVEVNAPLIDEQANHRGLVHRDQAEQVAAAVMSLATAVYTVSEALVPWVKRFSGARGGEHIHVVPNGVDPSRFGPQVKPAVPRQPNTLTIGFLGTLKPWHGLETLFDVFARLHSVDPTWRLLIVGDGPLRQELEQRAAPFAEAVRFTGAVEHQEVPALLASMDIAVAPYPPASEFYFSPMKLYEYMAAGLPIVAAAIGQIMKAIDPGVTGVLCVPGDVPAWTRTLAYLRNEPLLRETLGAAARRTAVQHHSWDRTIQTVLSLVEDSSAAKPQTEKISA
jgi:glycosyltransferase involved in cell wall biosynthesis